MVISNELPETVRGYFFGVNFCKMKTNMIIMRAKPATKYCLTNVDYQTKGYYNWLRRFFKYWMCSQKNK